jgi:NADH:ubiquinone reductase (non-electrogenic)
VNFNVTGYDNVFAIGDCAYSGLMPSAQVAFQQGKFLANHFNSGFWNNHSFKFRNLGQICYVGKGNSVYKLNDMVFKGKFTGYFNSVIHAYNAINFKQSWNNLWK